MSSEEINESELSELLKKSKDTILEYIHSHPEVIYKGIPLVFIIYMIYPFLFTFWAWLPWIWASYHTYMFLPRGTFSLFQGIVEDKKWITEILNSMRQNQN